MVLKNLRSLDNFQGSPSEWLDFFRLTFTVAPNHVVCCRSVNHVKVLPAHFIFEFPPKKLNLAG